MMEMANEMRAGKTNSKTMMRINSKIMTEMVSKDDECKEDVGWTKDDYKGMGRVIVRCKKCR